LASDRFTIATRVKLRPDQDKASAEPVSRRHDAPTLVVIEFAPLQ
jgi:hypothetical protein